MRVPANAGFEFGAFRLPVGLSRVPSRLRIAPMINDTGGGDGCRTKKFKERRNVFAVRMR